MAATGGATSNDKDALSITVEFGGGMEVLFDYKRAHQIQIPKKTASDADVDIRYLIRWLVENLLTDKTRTDLFAQGESVRPGILVLVNDTDWELEGELDYKIQPRDSIMFISTLHGG